MLSRHGLVKIKVRALRRKVWFKVLSRVERGIIDLTIRCVERIQSHVLSRIVSDIFAKILRTLKSSFLETAMRVGREISDRVYGIALNWGNMSASGWKHDSCFIRFLGVNAVNKRTNLGGCIH